MDVIAFAFYLFYVGKGKCFCLILVYLQTKLNKKQNEKESNCIINYTGLRFDCLQAGTKERGKYGKRNEAED